MAFTEKDFYAAHFSPKDYLDTYYTFSSGKEDENGFLIFYLKNLHQAFILGKCWCISWVPELSPHWVAWKEIPKRDMNDPFDYVSL